jgi:hypothetical protein
VINFVFENLENLENFTNCPDVNRSGIKRFATSPITQLMVYGPRGQENKAITIQNLPSHYMICSGVNHHPDNWAGTHLAFRNEVKNGFSYLSQQYLKDLREGRAMLLLDQSLEGYQTTWLWEYFHTECKDYNINPRAIIYITGNLLCKEQYKNWADEHNISERMNVLPYAHFEEDVHFISKEMKLDITVEKHIQYKKENVDKIKTYNCLQKRLRAHRIWFYIHLYEANLLDHGLVSMNSYEYTQTYFEGRVPTQLISENANNILPLLVHGKSNTEHDDNFYIRRILDTVCLDSWISVVSEASFGDQDHTLFLSEKVFKPIACLHPFIVVGNKGSLKKLREMGYRTFEGFIDESYDELPTFERFEAIIESIKQVQSIQNKFAWYESMKDILIHNYNTFQRNSKRENPACIELKNHYKEYFNL